MKGLKAVKRFCIECWPTRGDSCDPNLLNKYPEKYTCPLYAVKYVATKTKIAKAIREYCLFCSGDSSKEVELCEAKDCELYDFRLPKKKATAL